MYKEDFSEYKNTHLAHTLSPDYLGKHDNGWEINGEIHSDYYEWINEFEASKGKMWVIGDFENEVQASSKKAYDEFIKLFPPEEWDYWDI